MILSYYRHEEEEEEDRQHNKLSLKAKKFQFKGYYSMEGSN